MLRFAPAVVVALFAIGCRRPSPTISADDAASLPITKSTEIPESPMILSAPDGGPIPAPPDVAHAPSDAFVTESGLASKVLRRGTGTTHPTSRAKVKVSYTGWATDGKMIDSSIVRGAPTTFRLSELIKGWTEALQLMVVGEQRRLWIPPALAYGESSAGGAPKGTLVFDVELVAIEPE